MPGPERKQVRDAPPTIVYGDNLDDLGNARFTGFNFAGGTVAVHQHLSNLSPSVFSGLVLLSLAFDVPTVARLTYRSENTIKTNAIKGYSRLRSVTESRTTTVNKASIGKIMLELGVYEIVEPAKPMGLSHREKQVVTLVADGADNSTVAEYCDLSPLTVKSHLARIGRKGGLGDRAATTLHAQMSGEIGNYLPDPSQLPTIASPVATKIGVAASATLHAAYPQLR